LAIPKDLCCVAVILTRIVDFQLRVGTLGSRGGLCRLDKMRPERRRSQHQKPGAGCSGGGVTAVLPVLLVQQRVVAQRDEVEAAVLGPVDLAVGADAERNAADGLLRIAAVSKDPRFGEWKEKVMWHGGTHELGRRIGKLLEQIVF
jgi:hypothetical protein